MNDITGREWELLNAFEDNREPGGLVYQFEYRVQVRKRKGMILLLLVQEKGLVHYRYFQSYLTCLLMMRSYCCMQVR